MKTFETEKNYIPEGATHYSNETHDMHFAWKNAKGESQVPVVDLEWLMFSPIRDWHPIPQTNIETPEEKEVEWVNGLPPAGVECEYAFSGGDYSDWFECEILYVGKQCVFIKTKDENLIKSFGCEELSVEICNTKFRKPETPQQREERERLESAHDLYCYANSIQSKLSCTYSWFLEESMRNDRERFLAIVDKTSYRKEG